MSVLRFSKLVLILALFIYSLVQFSLGISCNTESTTSSCKLSDSCLADNPLEHEEEECQRNDSYSSAPATYSHLNITVCPRHGSGYSRCSARVSNHSSDHFLITKINPVDLYALDPEHFSMSVSWNYTDAELAISQARGSLRGYELRVVQNSTVVVCVCMWEPRVFNITLGYNPNLRFRHSSMKIEVFTLPFDPIFPEDHYSRSTELVWPSTCNDKRIIQSLGFCPPILYGSPQHVIARSKLLISGLKELKVSWDHPKVSPLPPAYYVDVYSGRTNFTIIANRTLRIKISGLNSSLSYSVQVQAYSSCSGLSSYYSGLGDKIGCGRLSNLVSEDLATTSSSSPPPPPHSDHSLFIIALPVSFLILLALIIAVICIVVHYRRKLNVKGREAIPSDPWVDYLVPSIKPDKIDVLVLYSLKTPIAERSFIERNIVGRLKQERFNVLSCNDYTEKTVVEWVEEQVRLARSVLIVCNKSFHDEWEATKERSPLINSLMIIIRSLSLSDIEKYATVLLDEGEACFIPDNLYLSKSMKRFVMQADMKYDDLEKINSFIRVNS